MTLIGFDFSINKPAACILKNERYYFISWPYGLSESNKNTYKDAPILLVERTDDKDKGDNVSEKLRYEVENSKYLAKLILNSISPFIDDETYLAFEGLSYGSSGDVVLQLGGYKYILMDVLSDRVSLDNMYTYAPITIKKTAGCSKKGQKKADMIEAFKNAPTEFSDYLKRNEEEFKTKKGNWLVHLDDIVDAYWTLETLREKIHK
ncbi:MAG: hypothetical protein GYA51_13625 [Candidatus Methanofastidiosa archaeon]|nr:hypothetical protein [Candidatus Methanofastidiosa archaeon]